MYFLKVFLLVLSFHLSGPLSDKNMLKIQFINDFINFENRPVQIIAYLCWESCVLRDLVKITSQSARVSGISVMDSYKTIEVVRGVRNHLVYIIDLMCNSSTDLILKANNLSLLSHPYRWIIFNLEEQDIQKILRPTNIYLQSDITILEGTVPELHISQFYKISPSKDNLIRENYGKWIYNFRSIVDERTTTIASLRRMNLQRSIFRLTHVLFDNDSLLHLNDHKNVHIDTLFKMSYRLAHNLLSTLNVTTVNQFTQSYGYYRLAPDNTTFMDGQIGDLYRNKCDLGVSAMLMTAERAELVRYLMPTTKSYGAIIFRSPPLSYVHNLFLLPFTGTIWITSGLLLLVMSIVMYLAMVWEGRQPDVDYQNRLEARYADIILLNISALCQQGTSTEPRSGPGRVIMIVLLIFMMFLYISYSAHIVVLLQSSSTSIQTIQNLIDSNLKLISDDTIFFHYYLNHNPDPLKLELNRRKQPKFVELSKGVAEIRNQQIALLCLPLSGYKLVQDTYHEHEKCDFQEIDFLGASKFWPQAQCNSSYMELLKVGYLRMAERGIQFYEFERIFTQKPKCLGKISHFTSIGLLDIYAAFYVLLIGMGISVMVIFLEYFYAKHYRHKTKPFQKIHF